jgi:hypothetical protein
VAFDTKEGGTAASIDVVMGGGGPVNATPMVNISSPLNNSAYTTADVVSLVGTATDDEEGDLTGSLGWTSSRDGFLGSAGSLMVGSLSAGTHVITASVTDMGGAGETGSASVTIMVTAPGGGGGTATLATIADTFTRSTSTTGDRNYGTNPIMRVERPGTKISYLQFDTSGLTGPVSSALLTLSVDEVIVAGTVSVHAIEEAWTETGITANNSPSTAVASAATFPVLGSDVGTEIQVDITALVAAWQASPGTAFGLALRHVDTTRVAFDTKEGGSAAFIDVDMN